MLMKNKIGSRIGTAALSLVMMLFIICFAVTFTLNFKTLFYMDIKLLDIPAHSGFSEELIRTNYDILIDYNNFWGPDKLIFDGLAMSETGRIHFEEVKVIFEGFEYLCIITAIILAVGVFFKLKAKDYFFLKLGGILTIVIPTVIAGLIGLNWEWVFVKFHEIAFNNDYWIFSYETDPVILMLPDEFFMHCALMIVAVTILLSVASIVIYGIVKRRKNG